MSLTESTGRRLTQRDELIQIIEAHPEVCEYLSNLLYQIASEDREMTKGYVRG